jgi:hypothetical protein
MYACSYAIPADGETVGMEHTDVKEAVTEM